MQTDDSGWHFALNVSLPIQHTAPIYTWSKKFGSYIWCLFSNRISLIA